MSSMVAIVTCILLFVLMLLALAVAGVYSLVPLKEIKRRANRGDLQARGLYHVVRHGKTAILLLQLCAVLAFACLSVIASKIFSWPVAVLVIAFLVLCAYSANRLPKKSVDRVAGLLAPQYARFLVQARPITNIASRIAHRFVDASPATGIYEVEDLVNLLETQKNIHHNRIEKTELDMAINALSFGAKVVEDYMIPRKVVHFVRAEEPVGPVLMSELHDSGFSRFPVRKEGSEDIVGTLYLKDLVQKRASGIVSNIMSPDVFYVRETDTLENVLASFLKTKHHLFIVRDQFAEIIGIITIEDVLEQVLGRRIVDESDVHEDMREEALTEVEEAQ